MTGVFAQNHGNFSPLGGLPPVRGPARRNSDHATRDAIERSPTAARVTLIGALTGLLPFRAAGTIDTLTWSRQWVSTTASDAVALHRVRGRSAAYVGAAIVRDNSGSNADP